VDFNQVVSIFQAYAKNLNWEEQVAWAPLGKVKLFYTRGILKLSSQKDTFRSVGNLLVISLVGLFAITLFKEAYTFSDFWREVLIVIFTLALLSNYYFLKEFISQGKDYGQPWIKGEGSSTSGGGCGVVGSCGGCGGCGGGCGGCGS